MAVDLKGWRKKILRLGDRIGKRNPVLGEWIKANANRIIEWYLKHDREMTIEDLEKLMREGVASK